MRNRVESHKKKSPSVLFRDRFHLSALSFSGEFSLARKKFAEFSETALIFIHVRLIPLRSFIHSAMLALITVFVL